MLDGQQRITRFGRFVTNKIAIKINGLEQYFSGLSKDKQKLILESPLVIYECVGEEREIKAWFETINIAGVALNDQELRNAIYSGTFVTLAKAEFSNSQNSNIPKWSAYIKGSANRQEFLECALNWASHGNIANYGLMLVKAIPSISTNSSGRHTSATVNSVGTCAIRFWHTLLMAG